MAKAKLTEECTERRLTFCGIANKKIAALMAKYLESTGETLTIQMAVNKMCREYEIKK